MRGAMSIVLAAALCSVCSASVFDEGLNGKCLEWVLSSQKDMIILNQVASHSQIASCSQYCMIAGNGFRADTTTCKLLCDTAGGYDRFSKALTLENGFAAPETICKTIVGTAAESDDAVSMLEVGQVGQSVQKKVGIRGDCTIQGTLSCNVLTSPIGDVKVAGQLNVVNAIEANSASAAYVKADGGVSVKQGIVSKQDQLLVKGKIDADSVTSTGTISYSFLEIDGVRQWSLQSLEDFEELGTDGWSHAEMTECGGRKILGGHCVEKDIPELTKTFKIAAPHTSVRVVAKYLFIDSWDGESGYLKINGNTVWTEAYNHKIGDASHGINVCGNETPERKLYAPIDVTVPHTGEDLTLSFGATLDEHPCDESFGIDSVMIFTR